MVSIHYPVLGTYEFPHFYEGFSGYYPDAEYNTRNWFVQNVRPDWIMMDCGAHIGTYTVLFAKLAKQVHAVEPTSTMEMLIKNLQHHKATNVVLYKVALGAKSGRYSEYIHQIWGEVPLFYEWEFITIDEIVSQFKIQKLDCIKIDVDSYDFDVLKGAQETLRVFKPIVVVELNDALKLRGHSVNLVVEWLNKLGYTPNQILDGENYVFKR